MEEKIIEVKGLCKQYKDFQLKNISFHLDRGYILGVIGRNGAGKTTIMNCILGKIKYDAGTIQIEGSKEQLHCNMAKENLGCIIEPGPFFVAETLGENGELLGGFYKTWNDKDFYRLLRDFGLDKDKRYGDLSKGMKTKFQLAFALAHKPKLLILDEPTGGLDPVFRQEFLSMIQAEVRDRLMSVIISTHLTADLDKVADYIMMIDDGEMVFYMNKEEMLDSYPLISGNLDKLSVLEKSQCGRIRKKHGTFTTMLKNPRYLKEHLQICKELQVERANIEEIMYYLSEDNE